MSTVFIDTETTSLDPFKGSLVAIGYAIDNGDVKQILWEEKKEDECQVFQALLQSDATKVFHHANFDLLFLAQAGFKINPPYFDTQIFYHLMNPNESSKLKDLGLKELEWNKVTNIKDIVVTKEPGRWKEQYLKIGCKNTKGYGWVRKTSLKIYLAQDVKLTRQLYYKALTKGIPNYYNDIERPLIDVILKMELRGMKIDKRQCMELLAKWSEELQGSEEYFTNLSINPRSSKQVSEYITSGHLERYQKRVHFQNAHSKTN